LTVEEIKSSEIQLLIQEMKKVMRDAPGVGLAAPQIGISIQLAVIEDPAERVKSLSPEVLSERGRIPVEFHVIINPKIIELTGRTNYFFEGCLSINGRARVTPRKEMIKVQYLDEKGEAKEITASGWYARILQHEIGHLNGQLYIDISDARSEIETNEEYQAKWANASRAQIYQFYREQCPDIKIDCNNHHNKEFKL
jgi:peptide deformylase